VCYEKLNYSDENLALAAIELWMREFYAVTKIALDDKVKLMKALKGSGLRAKG
jgi:hypothetical protein